MERSSKDLVRSVDKAIDLLETLAADKDGLGLTALASQTELPKTTVFRILSTLSLRGYVERDPGGEAYRLGLRNLLLGSAILERFDLRKAARPTLEGLAKATQEVVHLAVFDCAEAVYIDKVESLDHPIRIYSQIGRRIPAHCTGLGKVFLAGMGERELEAHVARAGLRRYTDTTITELARLKSELAEIRRRGYAIDDMEHERGILCVAAPVFDRAGKLCGALSVSGPETYIPRERLPALIEAVTGAARQISRDLGCPQRKEP